MLALFFIFTFVALTIPNAYAIDLQPADLIPLKSDLTLFNFHIYRVILVSPQVSDTTLHKA